MQCVKLDYNSPAALRSYMDEASLAMRKQYGQNFLVNSNARTKLCDAVLRNSGGSPVVWEVGPGLGAVTSELLERGAHVVAFEIDKAFASSLECFFAPYIASGALRIVRGDVLKTWEKEAASGDWLEDSGKKPPCLFGNLPYNIAATLIASIIESGARKRARVPFDRCVITVQTEVAKRFAARHGEDDYSSLSVVCQWAYKVRTLMDISAASFWPRPHVSSRSIVLERRNDFPRCRDAALFMRMTRALFASRRKTIRNNLTRFMSSTDSAEYVLRMAQIDSNVRAETLDIDTLLRISDIIAEKHT